MTKQPDWSTAPVGATHYLPENEENFACWTKKVDGQWFVWVENIGTRWIGDDLQGEDRYMLARPTGDYARLLELTEKATQGEWWIDSHGHRVTSLDSLETIFVADDRMGPATRHPETGNLSHWPNDWDATYIVAAQPKVVKALIEEVITLREKVSELSKNY